MVSDISFADGTRWADALRSPKAHHWDGRGTPQAEHESGWGFWDELGQAADSWGTLAHSLFDH